ncbi:RICIN domain-containing protein [Streptomyces sp. PU-14G]|uniref:RICIN domain-containing protein n=1 Tax=Streptomyces sp. PU-14G TaxID=2800808 RepID=UPI0034DEE423
MPQHDDEGQTEPQVRRAVRMPGAASQPASASLRPQPTADPDTGRTEEASSPEGSSSGSAASGSAASGSASSEGAGERGDGERGDGQSTLVAAPSPSISETPSSARSASASGARADSSEGSAPAVRGADENGGAAVGASSRAEGGTPPGASRGEAGTGGDVPPSGRPTKALLAAAGIGGALLIAVPFLVMGARDDDKTEPAAVAKDSSARTLQKDEEETRPGDYAPKPPEVENKVPKGDAPKEKKGTPSDESASDESTSDSSSDESSSDESASDDSASDSSSDESTSDESSSDSSSDESPSDESSSESSSSEDEPSSESAHSDEPVSQATVPEPHFLKPRLFLAPEPTPSEAEPSESAPSQKPSEAEPSTPPPEKKKKPEEGPEIKKKVAPPNYANAKHVLLKNVASKLCADVPAFGKGKPDGPVNQYHCDGTDKDNQIWDFEVKEKGEGPRSTDLFQIRNRKDGLCMDLPNFGGQPRGTRVSEFHCDGTTADNQLWWLEPRGDKKFRIHNYASDQQCLKMKTGKNIDPVDARLEIQPCHDGGPFEWTF